MTLTGISPRGAREVGLDVRVDELDDAGNAEIAITISIASGVAVPAI